MPLFTSATKCRDEVWRRDEYRCRATGAIVYPPSQAWSFTVAGHVHHLKGRRVEPSWVLDSDRQCLLSGEMHRLTTGVFGGKLLKLFDPDDPTMPAVDATKPILFIRVDKHGTELWRRIR